VRSFEVPPKQSNRWVIATSVNPPLLNTSTSSASSRAPAIQPVQRSMSRRALSERASPMTMSAIWTRIASVISTPTARPSGPARRAAIKGRCPRRTRYRRPRRLEECVRLRADFRFRRTRTSRPAVKPRVPRDRSRAPSRHIQGRDESESRRQAKSPPGSRCSGFRISVSRHRRSMGQVTGTMGLQSRRHRQSTDSFEVRFRSNNVEHPIVKHYRRKGGGDPG
jgi:hypothetical protein